MPKQLILKHIAAVALGSNLPSEFGGLEDNLRVAVARIGGLGLVCAVSSFQMTDPVGFTEQPCFLNGALLVETQLKPQQLLVELLGIEAGMGRRRDGVPPKGPRIIDLDLLWVDDICMKSNELTLPHPALPERSFVLEPLAEIAPDWIHPTLGVSVIEMLRRLEI